MLKLLVLLILAIIVGSLGSGMVFLIRDKGGSQRTVKALTVRIALSLGLFVLLFIAAALGLITPHSALPVF